MLHQIFKWAAVVWTLFCMYGCVTGMVETEKAIQGSEYEGAGRVGQSIGFMMWLFIWGVPTGALGILAMVFRPRKDAT